MSLTLTIAVFGRLADSVGDAFSFDVGEACSVADLRQRLADSFPPIRADLLGSKVRFCVGDALVPDDHILAEGRRVDILSPLSGG
jgi:molybdopterin converting factor small subunit